MFFCNFNSGFRWSFVDGKFRGLVGRASRGIEINGLFFAGCGGRGVRRTLVVTVGKFAVSRGFVRISSVGIDVLQRAAAQSSFGEAAGASVQGCQALIDALIAGRERQGREQRSKRLLRHVIRDEEFGVGESGAYRERDFIRVMLVNGGSGGFEIVDEDDRFFGRDQLGAGSSAELADHLLIILHVQGVLRLDLRQTLVKIAGAGKIAGLHAGVSEQFEHFADVRRLPGLVEEVEQLLQQIGVLAHVSDDGVQMLENFFGIFRQQALGVLIVNLQRIFVLAGLHERFGEARNGGQIVVNREQLVGDGSRFGKLAGLQICLEQIFQAVGVGVDVGNFVEGSGGAGRVAGFKQVLALHEQRISVARIEREHALQNFFRALQRSLGAQAFSRGGENLPGFGFLAQANVDFGQADAHSTVFRIHLQNFLEDADGIFEFAGLQEFFRDLQVLRAGVIEQALLRVEFSQLQQALKRRLELADFLVHRDGFDGETLAGVGVAYGLEAVGSFVDFAEARIEVTHGVGDGEVLRVILENFFVLRNGILRLALLDILLRSGENLLFVETEQCHKSANSRTCLRCCELCTFVSASALLPGLDELNVAQHNLFSTIRRKRLRETVRKGLLPIGQIADRTRPIVRPRARKRVVTKGYRKGVYDRVTKGIEPRLAAWEPRNSS